MFTFKKEGAVDCANFPASLQFQRVQLHTIWVASKDEFACLAKSWKRKTIFFETEIGRLYIHFSTPIILS